MSVVRGNAELIEAYASAGVTQFSFTGGEALLKEGCLELMDFASKRAQAGLLSNGRAMTEDVLRFCAERGIHVMMSMPGLTSFAANTDSDTSVEHILSMFGRAHELGCATTVGMPLSSLARIHCSSTASSREDAAFRIRSLC